MTAERIAEYGHRWPLPPLDGYTVDDLFTLPDLPPHTELIDGSLVFVSPQRRFHYIMIDLLVRGLRRTVSADLSVEREMTILLDRRNGPEADVSVVRAEAVVGLDQTSFQAADVLLAVEVISPESEFRDRDTKPHKYANAGICHYWLVEAAGSDKHPVVRTHELDPTTKQYKLTGIHADHLKLSDPFDIDIDISLEALRTL